jgi:hypothetical protein
LCARLRRDLLDLLTAFPALRIGQRKCYTMISNTESLQRQSFGLYFHVL